MLTSVLILFNYISSSFLLSKRINKENFGAWWIILLLTGIIISVQILGFFELINKNNLLIISFIFFGAGILFEIRKETKITSSEKPFHPKDLPGLLAIFLLIGILTIINEITPYFETDSLSYHLPIVTQIIRSGGILDIFHAAFTGPNTYFPANHESMEAFLFFINSQYNLYFLINLLGIILFTLSIKKLSNKTPYILIITSLISIISIPFLFEQLFTQQVDLMMLCLFGSAVSTIISSTINNSKEDFAKSFLIIGLMIGTKYNGLAEAIYLLPLLAFCFIHFKKSVKQTLFFPLLTILGGGGWYLRNLILTGNPFYPLGLKFGPINFEGHLRIMEELKNSSLWSSIQNNGLNSTINYVLNHPNFNEALGKIVLIIFPVTLLIWLISVSRTLNENKKNFLILTTFIYLFISQAIYYLNAPYTYTLWHQTIRYSSSIFAIIPITFAYCSERSKKTKLGIIIFSALFTTANLLNNHLLFNNSYFDLIKNKLTLISANYFIILSISLFLVILTICTITKQSKKIINILLILTISTTIVFYEKTTEKYLQKKSDINNIFLSKKTANYETLLPFLETLKKDGEQKKIKIAITGLTIYWLFYNEGYDPVYINIDGCLKCKYANYKKEKNSIRSHPDETKWKEALKKAEVNYLLIFTKYIDKNDQYEKIWAEKNKKMFKIIKSSDNLMLFRLQNT